MPHSSNPCFQGSTVLWNMFDTKMIIFANIYGSVGRLTSIILLWNFRYKFFLHRWGKYQPCHLSQVKANQTGGTFNFVPLVLLNPDCCRQYVHIFRIAHVHLRFSLYWEYIFHLKTLNDIELWLIKYLRGSALMFAIYFVQIIIVIRWVMDG